MGNAILTASGALFRKTSCDFLRKQHIQKTMNWATLFLSASEKHAFLTRVWVCNLNVKRIAMPQSPYSHLQKAKSELHFCENLRFQFQKISDQHHNMISCPQNTVLFMAETCKLNIKPIPVAGNTVTSRFDFRISASNRRISQNWHSDFCFSRSENGEWWTAIGLPFNLHTWTLLRNAWLPVFANAELLNS